MAFPKKYNTIVINLLLAVVICLVINFSYLLAIREQNNRDFGTAPEWSPESGDAPRTGILRVSPDGYGYILSERLPESFSEGRVDTLADRLVGRDTLYVSDSIPPLDSIYVRAGLINRFSLRDSNTLSVIARNSQTPGANRFMRSVLEIDGVPFDYGTLYSRPSNDAIRLLQMVFYLLFAFILLTVMTVGAARGASMRFYLIRAAYCIVIAVLLWLLLPVSQQRSGELIITAMNLREGGSGIDALDILKCSFVLAFALLWGRTYQLLSQREGIMLENERLKSENLSARYNTLVNQINPHFLFNSLNSLSALVREGRSDDAVSYIDRLSDTFRYTIRNEPHTTTTLAEELEFVAAYKYLLEIRYDEKLFIDIDVEEDKLGWTLPTFSIQPLIENAVKHNTISRSKPLHISIRTEGDSLVVSNPINPKIQPEKGTGIGLTNLSRRWLLLTGRGIEVRNDGRTFTVALPFL